MPKPLIKHQTADGVVQTRQTARTYTHVVVATFPKGIPNATDGHVYPPGYCTVWNWVGRPDLVAGALAESTRRIDGRDITLAAEPINNGVRA